MSEKVLVLGAGFAGLTSALRLSRRGFNVEIIDINSVHEFTPDVVNLYRARVPEKKLTRDIHSVVSGTGIEFSREVVQAIRPNQKMVDTNAGSHDYDYLVLALGSQPRNFGVDLTKAETPYNLESTRKIVRKLDDVDTVTVVGAGYVGVEVASEIAELGKSVTVADNSTRPMSTANESSSYQVLEYMNRKNITFRPGQRVEEVSEKGVILENGKQVESDMVLWCAGVRVSELVQKSFDTGPCGVGVDHYMRSDGYDDVFVAGDAADTTASKTAHNALEQAKIIGHNIGRDEEDMKTYSPGTYPMLVSLGKTGMIVFGRRAVVNRVFRHMKDLVRHKYWFDLKREEIFAKIF